MNKVKIALLFSFILLGQTEAFSQKYNSKLSDSCSNIISGISHFWIKDSLGVNGYRMEVYKRIINCKTDTLHAMYILKKLGPPKRIEKTNKGSMITYVVFDGTRMPEPSFEIVTIYFIFDSDDKLTDRGESVEDKWKNVGAGF